MYSIIKTKDILIKQVKGIIKDIDRNIDIIKNQTVLFEFENDKKIEKLKIVREYHIKLLRHLHSFKIKDTYFSQDRKMF